MLTNPRVLLVGNFLSATRANRGVCEELAAHLVDAGWVVSTVSSCPGRVARLVDMVTTVFRERAAYDVAHVDVYSGTAFIWAEAVVESLVMVNRPFVLTLHGGNLPTFAQRWPRRMRRLLRRAAAVTTPSRYLLQSLRAYRDDLILMPNAVDLSHYRARVRTSVSPQVVWLRAFHEIYNPVLAVETVAALVECAPRVALRMAGADRHDGTLEHVRAVVAARGLDDRVTIRDGVAKCDVPQWLASGDIFLNTANIDNTPVTVIEAMASGLCIVSTNVGGIPFLLDEERDALMVPPNDATAMARAVRRLLDDPSLAARLAANARAKAAEFDWGVVLPRWLELFVRVSTQRAA